MKQSFVLALLAVSAYFYFRGSPSPPSDNATRSHGHTVAAQSLTVVPAPSSYIRWNTGPNAQTDLKTGPNAQTDFEPFAPSEQATWNRTPGWTVVSGIKQRVR